MNPLDKLCNNYYYIGKTDCLKNLFNNIVGNEMNKQEILKLIQKEIQTNSNKIIK